MDLIPRAFDLKVPMGLKMPLAPNKARYECGDRVRIKTNKEMLPDSFISACAKEHAGGIVTIASCGGANHNGPYYGIEERGGGIYAFEIA